MSQLDLSNFPFEVRQPSVVSMSISGDKDVVVLNSKIPRHLIAHRSDPAKLAGTVQAYYQSNTFLLCIGGMTKVDHETRSSLDSKAPTDLNKSGIENLRKLLVKVYLEDLHRRSSYLQSHGITFEETWVHRTLALDIPRATNITELTIDCGDCRKYPTDNDIDISATWQGFKHSLSLCIGGLKNLKRFILTVCNQQDLVKWINARVAVEGTYVNTIYAAPDPKACDIWLWVAADTETLKWKNTEDLGESLQVVGASSDEEYTDGWDSDESESDAEVDLSGEHLYHGEWDA